MTAKRASMSLFFMLISFSSLFVCAHTAVQLIAAGSIPDIVVDGEIDDWQGIKPIVNDTGGVSSPYSIYDLTNCYVLTDPTWFYFLFMKTPVGSAIWIIYFDVDSSNQTGDRVNNMGADFRYNHVGEKGFYNWTDNDWHKIDSSGTQSRRGAVGSGSNSTEWVEGKIAMNALGNPASFRVVFHIKGGEDVAPKTGYITVVNDAFAVAVSFTTSKHVLSRNETSNLAFRIQNYGTADINKADVRITLPPQLAVISGENLWSGAINCGQTVECQITVQALAYGNTTSDASFSLNTGSLPSFMIPLTLVTAPRIALQIRPVHDFRLGAIGAFNVTVTNMDPYTAETTIETLSYSDINRFYVHMVLEPESSLQSSYNVTLTEVGHFDFIIHAVFEGIELARASTLVTVQRPNIWISSTNVTTDMQLGAEYPLTVTVQNDEDYTYSINVSATFDYQQPGEAEHIAVDLPARSNRTVTLEIKPREQGTHYIDVSLIMYEVMLSTECVYDVDVRSNYVVPPTSVVIIIVVVAASAYLILRSRQRRSRRLAIP